MRRIDIEQDFRQAKAGEHFYWSVCDGACEGTELAWLPGARRWLWRDNDYRSIGSSEELALILSAEDGDESGLNQMAGLIAVEFSGAHGLWVIDGEVPPDFDLPDDAEVYLVGDPSEGLQVVEMAASDEPDVNDYWWALKAYNSETRYAWGTRGDADHYCSEVLNKGRQINLYAPELLEDVALAAAFNRGDRTDGFDLAEALDDVEAEDTDTLVCGHQIQRDDSGVGHCWRNIDRESISADVVLEIEAEIIDGGKDSCDDFVGSNGQHYRW